MRERYSPGTIGGAIERVATDNDLWKTLTALHFVCSYCRKRRTSIDLAVSRCYSLLQDGIMDDRLLAGELMQRLAKNGRGVKGDLLPKNLRSILGKGVLNDIKHRLGNNKSNPRFCKRKSRRVSPLASERYALSRDGAALERYAIDHGYWFMLLAVHYANKRHMGEKRRDGSDGIDHPFRICWDLINRLDQIPGLSRIIEFILVVALLHDSIENTRATEREIGGIFGRKTADHVNRLSRKPGDKLNPEKYYQGIVEKIVCLVVKAVDKENILGDMMVGLPPEKQINQIREVLTYLMPAMKEARKANHLFRGILFSCRNRMISSITDVQYHLGERKETGRAVSVLLGNISELLVELDS